MALVLLLHGQGYKPEELLREGITRCIHEIAFLEHLLEHPSGVSMEYDTSLALKQLEEH